MLSGPKPGKDRRDATGGAVRHKPRALIVTEHKPTRKRVKRALLALGCEVKESPCDRQACCEHMAQPLELCIIDVDNDGIEIDALVDTLRQVNPSCPVILTADVIARTSLLNLVVDKMVSNVIAKRPGATVRSRAVDELEFITTCSKLLSDDIFGIDKYLPGGLFDTQEEVVKGTEDRYRVVECLAGYLESLSCPERMISLICTATDELIMNAIFSAPTDEAGAHRYADADRSAPLVLEPHELVTTRYVCDGYNVVVSVVDNFGSLSRATLVEHLRNGWLGHQKAVRWDTGGAGLGLHLVFSSAVQFIANIEPGVRTELITIYYIREGLRRLSEMGHSLNLFYRT